MPPTAPVICLPGLGADRRLFQPLLASIETAVIPAWPTDLTGKEGVDDLAAQMLDELQRQSRWKAGVVLVGFSFGGQVALSLTREALLRGLSAPHAVVLLSAPATHHDLTPRFRRQVGVSRWLPHWFIGWAAHRLIAGRFAEACGLDTAHTARLRAMAADLDGRQFKRLARIATHWSFGARDAAEIRDAGVSIRALHATDDPVIPAPARDTPGLQLIPGRAHLLPWTHADIVHKLIMDARAADVPLDPIVRAM